MSDIVNANPKDRLGIKKPSVWAVPMTAVYIMGQAMLDGVRKYGLFNWREHEVRADIYIEAARRHLNAWAAMEEKAEDSGVHHLGHAMACMAILLDAQQNDKLVDNRMPDPAYLKWIKEQTNDRA